MILRRKKKPDVLQGTLDLLILTALRRVPQHGYGIAARIQAISADVLRVEEGSLYEPIRQEDTTSNTDRVRNKPASQ